MVSTPVNFTGDLHSNKHYIELIICRAPAMQGLKANADKLSGWR